MPSPKIFASLTDDVLAPLRALFDARVPPENEDSWWAVPPASSFEDYLQDIGSRIEGQVTEDPMTLESKVWNTATLEGIGGLIVDVKDEATAREKIRATVHDILTSDVHQKVIAADIKKKALALARKLPAAAPASRTEVTRALQVLLREICDWRINYWLSSRQQEIDLPRLRALRKIQGRLQTDWISSNWARMGPLLVTHRSQRPDATDPEFQEWEAEERRLLAEFHRQPPFRELEEEAERELKRMQTSSLTEAQSRATGRTPRPDREGKRLVAGHFDAETAEKIKDFARARRTTVQAILEEAVNDLFTKYDRQVVAIEKFAKDFNKP